MASASNIAHRGLPFANPMREADVDRALASLALPSGALVLDTGCGSGEMLLRALERDATWRGLGVDLDPDAIAEARARAAERLPGRDVRFEVRDAGEVTGRHDAVLNVGSSHVHGGYPAALRALRGARGGGGTVVYGEGYWREPPSAAFLEALGGATEDELDNLGGLRSNVLSAGFDIASLTEAGEAGLGRLRGDARGQRRARRRPGDGRVREKDPRPPGPPGRDADPRVRAVRAARRGAAGGRRLTPAPPPPARPASDDLHDRPLRGPHPAAGALEPDLDHDLPALQPAPQRLAVQRDPVHAAAHLARSAWRSP